MIHTGIDIVEIDRLDNIKEGFIEHVLSSEEIKLYNAYEGHRKKEFLAGRFAAKEAIIKCLSDFETPLMSDIVVLNNEKGKPIAKYKDYQISLSISHETHYAVAMAILEK